MTIAMRSLLWLGVVVMLSFVIPPRPTALASGEDRAGCPDWAHLRNVWRSDDCRDDPWMCQEEIGNIYLRAEENIRRAGRNEAFALVKAARRPGGKIVIVRKGDSFSSLFGRDWRRIADLNGYEATWKYRLGKFGQEPKMMLTDRGEQEVGLRLQEGDVLFVPPQGWKLAATPHSALHAAN